MAGKAMTVLAVCRDCEASLDLPDTEDRPKRCPACRSPRLLAHTELSTLTIAHIDCDAFYAAVEKRDDPTLADKPVIIGGGKRGVVSTACYTARIYGIHSAMPMFKALKACPHAVVLRPNMAKYAAVGKQVKALMTDTTPLVESVSIDEAFLDLTGTERLHKKTAAQTLIKLVQRIETEIGITVSVGLSYNKFLAKLASDMDKPRGFSVIGRAETRERLAPLPIGKIWGVGRSLETRLKKRGIYRIGQLQACDENEYMKQYGEMGRRLVRLANGVDSRSVHTHGTAKSISSETTFFDDLTMEQELTARLWPLCEQVSARAKKSRKMGQTVTLKLKTASFKSRTRSQTLHRPTQLAEILFRESRKLLLPEIDGTPFRLIGVGISGLVEQDQADLSDLFDDNMQRMQATESAIDKVREKFGDKSIQKGRTLKKPY